MKENLLDILIYLFDYCIDDDHESVIDQAEISDELAAAGFLPKQINQAFAWLAHLKPTDQVNAWTQTMQPQSMRLYDQEELERLSIKHRGFLLFLESTGVIDPPTRELIIDRAMMLNTADLTFDIFKWVILMVLFNRNSSMEDSEWLEELAFDWDEQIGQAH